MQNKYHNVIFLLLLAFTLVACGPDPQPDPDPQPSDSISENKAKEAKDQFYKKPGTIGEFRSTNPEDGSILDAEPGTEPEGSVYAGGLTDWQTEKKLDDCPDSPIYIMSMETDQSIPQCADGVGYSGLCDKSNNDAIFRAINAARSCERVPSCHARIFSNGQRWWCDSEKEVLPNGTQGKLTWWKGCQTQLYVVCAML